MAIQNNENTMANLDKILTKNEGFRQRECWSDIYFCVMYFVDVNSGGSIISQKRVANLTGH